MAAVTTEDFNCIQNFLIFAVFVAAGVSSECVDVLRDVDTLLLTGVLEVLTPC